MSTFGLLAARPLSRAMFCMAEVCGLAMRGRTVALTGNAGLPWPAWTVTAAWTAILAGLAAWVYRRDTARA